MYLTIGLSIVAFVIYLVTFLMFLCIKKRMKGEIVKFLNFLALVILFLILLRVVNLLTKLTLFSVPYLSEFLVVFTALSLLLAIAFLLNQVKQKTDKKEKIRTFKSIRNPKKEVKVKKKKISKKPKIRKIKKVRKPDNKREQALFKKYVK